MFYLDLVLVTVCLVGVLVAATYRISLFVWALIFASYSVIWNITAETLLHKSVFIMLILISGVCVFLAIPAVSRSIASRPFFRLMKEQNAHISSLEKQALSAGESGFEAGFFEGLPYWEMLRQLPAGELSKLESEFINGPIESFCEMANDWEIRQAKFIPDNLWNFAKTHRFSSLRVKKEWGGKEFSFQAQSLILSKVASRSIDASVLIELPVSLYPDEIIDEYGTADQKSYYLPRLARGEEVVSFAVTGVQGSDVGGMSDLGVVTYGTHEGERVLGIKLTFNKRYITFAPKASLFVLAFALTDPDGLLNGKIDRGITLALIPASHPGMKAGKRHFPSGLSFPHGPIHGDDVFIPLEWIIGASKGIGLGWKMIMKCLFVGRCLALPSISVGSIKNAFLSTTAYAQVRRQFGLPIITFEGVKEPIVKLAEIAYITESARYVSAALVDKGHRSLAVSSLMKYKITEFARQAVNYALDVHGGKGICDGPSNYLISSYNAVPIGVTVEGANIVSRSVITFAQGLLQSHPYLRSEIESCENNDSLGFEKSLYKHLRLFLANISRSLLYGLTFGHFAHAPQDVPKRIRRWYQLLSRYSSSFALISDVTSFMMGTQLKKKQRLGGRLADILSELFILSSVLKRYEDDGFPEEDYPIIELCMKNGLNRIQDFFIVAISNFPNFLVRVFLRMMIFPVGAWRSPANDELGEAVVRVVSVPGKTRERLSKHVYISSDSNDPIKHLELALEAAMKAQPVYKKIRAAVRDGRLQRTSSQLAEAERLGVITAQEVLFVTQAEVASAKAIAADSFDQNAYSS